MLCPRGAMQAAVGIKISKPSSTSLLDTGKIWFPSIMVDTCDTGILADGENGAHSCAFGYSWIRNCDICVELDQANATMFTFAFVHPLSSTTIFKVNGGGRIYVHSINIVQGPNCVLDITGGDLTTSFFQINGVTGDNRNAEYTLLKNHDDGNGLTHVRFTNCHFTSASQAPKNIAKIDIDRSSSDSGQTVVEIVGSRGLTRANAVLTDKVVIKGASGSKKSRLIIRDSEIPAFPGDPPKSQLINDVDASNYTENRIKNWVFNEGLRVDESQSG